MSEEYKKFSYLESPIKTNSDGTNAKAKRFEFSFNGSAGSIVLYLKGIPPAEDFSLLMIQSLAYILFDCGIQHGEVCVLEMNNGPNWLCRGATLEKDAEQIAMS